MATTPPPGAHLAQKLHCDACRVAAAGVHDGMHHAVQQPHFVPRIAIHRRPQGRAGDGGGSVADDGRWGSGACRFGKSPSSEGHSRCWVTTGFGWQRRSCQPTLQVHSREAQHGAGGQLQQLVVASQIQHCRGEGSGHSAWLAQPLWGPNSGSRRFHSCRITVQRCHQRRLSCFRALSNR